MIATAIAGPMNFMTIKADTGTGASEPEDDGLTKCTLCLE